jgi:hypothetical protein
MVANLQMDGRTLGPRPAPAGVEAGQPPQHAAATAFNYTGERMRRWHAPTFEQAIAGGDIGVSSWLLTHIAASV